MREILCECAYCGDKFERDDYVVLVNNESYHKKCVKLYPTSYVAFAGDVCLGNTDNDDGDMAYEYFDELLDEVEE